MFTHISCVLGMGDNNANMCASMGHSVKVYGAIVTPEGQEHVIKKLQCPHLLQPI